MRAGKRYRKLQGDLDKKGICTSIQRVSKNQFDFIINAEIIKSFKTRQSANKRIVKLHAQQYGTV